MAHGREPLPVSPPVRSARGSRASQRQALRARSDEAQALEGRGLGIRRPQVQRRR